MDEFAKLLTTTAKERGSRVILAADTDDWNHLRIFLRQSNKNFAAIKVHPEQPLRWEMRHEKAIRKIKEITEDLPVIVDAKLADIDRSNRDKAQFYFLKGYDAITTHAFQGEEAVRPVIEWARALCRGTFLVADMTSEGNLFTPEQTKRIVEMTKNLGATGVVAPGNDYKKLAGVRKQLGKKKLIISPGIDTQGGTAEKALEYSDFIIVGSSLLRE
jgi:orotidine 5'-phosphate decarboxylase subfamily 1